jgi:hypothetical protein
MFNSYIVTTYLRAIENREYYNLRAYFSPRTYKRKSKQWCFYHELYQEQNAIIDRLYDMLGPFAKDLLWKIDDAPARHAGWDRYYDERRAELLNS